MHQILTQKSELSHPLFNELCGDILLQELPKTKVLVIGAGGLGCEILKTLALSGIKEIHVVDLDTIDLSNLNRQFLFRQKDVGRYKAQVAAEFIMQRIPSCKVYPYIQKIQEYSTSFYEQFQVIIAGLDNVDARRWLNQKVVEMVQKDDNGNIIEETRHYLIDGGTEGFNGQARIIAPFESACYECTINQLPKQVQYQMCTIASTPRLPEHCIAYAYEIQWPMERPKIKLDKDNYEHMNWIYEQATKRAAQYHIEGVTYKLTIGVVKNIIPAVASTNALIASICVTECIKILTGNGTQLNNYFQWIGQAESTGVNVNVINQLKLESCPICAISDLHMKVDKNDLLKSFLSKLPAQSELFCGQQTIVTQNAQRRQHFDHYVDYTFQQLIDEKVIKPGLLLRCLDGTKTINIHVEYQ